MIPVPSGTDGAWSEGESTMMMSSYGKVDHCIHAHFRLPTTTGTQLQTGNCMPHINPHQHALLCLLRAHATSHLTHALHAHINHISHHALQYIYPNVAYIMINFIKVSASLFSVTSVYLSVFALSRACGTVRPPSASGAGTGRRGRQTNKERKEKAYESANELAT